MSKPIIEVKNLSKKYRITHQESYLALRDIIANCLRNPLDIFKKRFAKSNEDFWALKDVSFDVKEGEVVGIIGRNGAGKTTLLKILSRITYPIKGEACLRGRVGSLLEVGTGFHPELTGRENIFFNGAVLGMKKKEIERKYDEIVEFSGVEKFIDTPVKRFSSGMRVRLAFSVAAHLDPEILLIDEVLAVGDVQFQNKCLGKMKDVSESGRTILFVSHDMSAISRLCSRVFMFESGVLAEEGDPNSVVTKYLNQNLVVNSVIKEKDLESRKQGRFNRSNPMMRAKEIKLLNRDNAPCTAFRSGEPIKIEITYECLNTVSNFNLNLYIVDEENKTILISQNIDNAGERDPYQRKPGLYRSTCIIPPDMFGEKRFYLTAHLVYPKVEHLIYERVLGFNVAFEGFGGILHGLKDSFFRPRLNWSTERIGDVYEQ